MILLDSWGGKAYIIKAVSSSEISINISKVDTWKITVHNLIEFGTLVITSKDDIQGCPQTVKAKRILRLQILQYVLCNAIKEIIRFLDFSD